MFYGTNLFQLLPNTISQLYQRLTPMERSFDISETMTVSSIYYERSPLTVTMAESWYSQIALSNGESRDSHLEALEHSAYSKGVIWNTVHKLLLPQTVKQ